MLEEIYKYENSPYGTGNHIHLWQREGSGKIKCWKQSIQHLMIFDSGSI